MLQSYHSSALPIPVWMSVFLEETAGPPGLVSVAISEEAAEVDMSCILRGEGGSDQPCQVVTAGNSHAAC